MRPTSYCEVIVWEQPVQPNGNINGYNIRFDGIDVVERVNGSTHYAINKDQQGRYETVQVRQYLT